MFVKKTPGRRTATLPDGSILTLADLPPSRTRWVARRKAVVVAAVQHGLLSRDAALRRYDLTEEEFDSWQQAVSRHGHDALKITRLQKFKQL
ncbi:MAG TPA: DUF1153 domain-containing protein [Paracoccus sp. (in: a-proteobacteria)]|uniref:CtrA inhibitor SciP n=1 Tax=Paracoccus sp. TaxID=267 RepID=UPI002C19B90E|nr:DUF1153 domain-containing protein [Paracoccus sp. (in: a-proteobacteria)]HWL59072.1 DUF1153 domain-containing protein [Paracoccus sp. (in: a-proteobacteria)]